nr:hypothetical protein Iba_chr13bCG14320 [Ipomoea batatas]GMD76868.1 hypothetical protein Iba_chr13bCG14350 [Ipomoea batatas]
MCSVLVDGFLAMQKLRNKVDAVQNEVDVVQNEVDAVQNEVEVVQHEVEIDVEVMIKKEFYDNVIDKSSSPIVGDEDYTNQGNEEEIKIFTNEEVDHASNTMEDHITICMDSTQIETPIQAKATTTIGRNDSQIGPTHDTNNEFYYRAIQ